MGEEPWEEVGDEEGDVPPDAAEPPPVAARKMQVGFRRAHAYRRKEAALGGAEPTASSGVRSRRSVAVEDGHRGGACCKGAVVAAHIERETETDRARRRRVETQKAQEVERKLLYIFACRDSNEKLKKPRVSWRSQKEAEEVAFGKIRFDQSGPFIERSYGCVNFG